MLLGDVVIVSGSRSFRTYRTQAELILLGSVSCVFSSVLLCNSHIFFFKIDSFLSGLYYFYYDKIFYCLIKNALTKCEYYIPSLETINSRLRITKPGCSLSFDSDALWALGKKYPAHGSCVLTFL